MEKLVVNEIFESIQGEGIYTGADMTFVRFAGCSVGCIWCDTKYAQGQEDATKRDIENLFIQIASLRPPRVCFTGGEPLEQDHDTLSQLAAKLVDRGLDCHTETSGTIMPSEALVPEIKFWSISPKLSNAGNAARAKTIAYDLHTMYRSIVDEGSGRGQWKFVIRTEKDVKEVLGFVWQMFEDMCDWPIVLQPMGQNDLSIVDYYPSYFELMTKIKTWAELYLDGYDWRVMPQLHRLMWGDERGV